MFKPFWIHFYSLLQMCLHWYWVFVEHTSCLHGKFRDCWSHTTCISPTNSESLLQFVVSPSFKYVLTVKHLLKANICLKANMYLKANLYQGCLRGIHTAMHALFSWVVVCDSACIVVFYILNVLPKRACGLRWPKPGFLNVAFLSFALRQVIRS